MTGQEVVTNAMIDIGVIGAGESPSTEESDYGLVLLNQVIDSWSAEGTSLYQQTLDTVLMTAGSPYTLSTRPVAIQSALLTLSGLTVPVDIVTADVWAEGGGTQSRPQIMSDNGYPNTKIWVRPNVSSYTLELRTLRNLTAWATLSTDIALPPGYALAIRRGMALHFAQTYGAQVTDAMVQLASAAKTTIQGLNTAILGIPFAGLKLPQPQQGA